MTRLRQRICIINITTLTAIIVIALTALIATSTTAPASPRRRARRFLRAAPIGGGGAQLLKRLLPCRAAILIAILLICLLTPGAARADCTNPAGSAGKMMYNSDWRAVEYCDGTNWIAGGIKTYKPTAVTFDGTNDYLTRGADLTSNADSKLATGSFWVRRNGGNGTKQAIYSNTGPRFELSLDTSNQFRIEGGSASATDRIVAFATSPTITDTNWHHVMFSFDLANSSNRSIYIDGAAATVTWSTYSNNTIDFTVANHSIGALVAGTSKLNADLADFWLDFGTYTDFSNQTNENKFINSNVYPVYTGATGTVPTGAAVDILLAGALASWHTNDGSGGGFNLGGALTASELPIVEAGYKGSNGRTVTDGIQGWWKLDESGNVSTAADAGGGGAGTLTNFPADPTANWVAGQINNALDFDGSNDTVTIANESNFDFDRTQPFSISAWIYRDTANTEDDVLTKMNSSDFNAGFSLWIQEGGVDDNKLELDLNRSGGGGPIRANTTSTIAAGAWYHIAATYDGSSSGSNIKLYVNGSAAYTVLNTGPLTGTILNNNPVLIGDDTTAGTCCEFDGKIDDVRIYSRELSAAEVMQIYQYGNGCTSPAGAEGEVRYSAGTRHVLQFCNGRNWIPMGKSPGTGGGGCSNPAGAEGKIIYNNASSVMQYCDGANWRAIGGGVMMNDPMLTSGLVGWWKFDEGSGGSAADSIGSNNLTLSGASWTTGVSGSALSFNGTSDEASDGSVTGLPAFNAAITISAWAYTPSCPAAHEMLVTLAKNTAAFGRLGTGFDASCMLEVGKYGNSTAIMDYTETNYAIPTSQWHLFTYTWDGTTNRAYLDGVAHGTTTHAHDTVTPTSLWLGYDSSSYYYNGKIDDLRIYNRALSPGEILRLYQTTGGQ